MQMNNLICEEWDLYDTDYTGKISIDAFTGEEFADIKTTTKSLRVFGTQEQLKKLQKLYKIDEAYDFEVEQKLKEYAQLYELNDNKPLILRIK